MSIRTVLATIFAMVAASGTLADNSVTWVIDQTLSRDDDSLFWTSPTPIDLGLAAYGYHYEITRVRATVLRLTLDVTDQIGDSFDLVGAGLAPELPIVLLDEALADPETGTAANVFIEVDESGFGQAAFTEIALGRVSVPILGSLDIQSVRVEGRVTITGAAAPTLGDFNGDGDVDRADYCVWAFDYGSRDTRRADANTDGAVGPLDYVAWRDRFDSPLDATTIPEPSTVWLLANALSFARLRRRR